jgi:hypothetical protein
MLCRSEQKSWTWLSLNLLQKMGDVFMLGFVFFVSLNKVCSYFADLVKSWLAVYRGQATYLIQDQRPVSVVDRWTLCVFRADFDRRMQGRTIGMIVGRSDFVLGVRTLIRNCLAYLITTASVISNCTARWRVDEILRLILVLHETEDKFLKMVEPFLSGFRECFRLRSRIS